ncbi:GumC family protein [Leeuwenhoekiella blandensis]|uniref:non-specific protein-tyrosine kinase n=1 Tax=Leeuwenhoekiella blandensis (strain CECT 7118 / CCUG 51940 / KCTC 22103 / MED217) TaxID=398720 RepID=A3XR84_LEEBM|nr:tyrosine-protein kinase [Leeuwenhoekiella blandensis]EAQ47936.1 tyrosine-protein kinase ptk [Leeuwenhoekiella blandensis MED217]
MQSLNNNEEDFNLREELGKYLRYWPWFVLSGILALGLAFVYLKLTIPKYKTVASVIIKDDEGKTPSAGLANFAELGLMGGMGTNSIENEIGMFKSYRMMQNTIKALNLNVRYFDNSSFVSQELYLKSPLLVEVVRQDDKRLQELVKEEAGEFEFTGNFTDEVVHVHNDFLGITKDIALGTLVDLGFGEVVIKRNPNLNVDPDEERFNILISFREVNGIADYLRNEIEVNLLEQNATFLELSLESTVKRKSEDILNQLIFEYNKEAIEDKNQIALSTAEFINERLDIISNELDTVEVGLEDFKERNNLTNIEEESKLFIENASEYRERQRELNTQIAFSDALIEFLENDRRASDLLPGNIALDNNGLNVQIGNYNNAILQRNRLLEGATELNPAVKRLNAQIEQLEQTIYNGLQQTKQNFQIALDDLERQNSLIDSQISKVPSKERRFRDISRQQNIKEALYIFLLQKREENSLSLAATMPKAKIVDSGYSSNKPVAPKPLIILVLGLILGLGIPFGVIYIKRLLNNKIESREDIEKVTKSIPIVGELPNIPKGEIDLVTENDRSVLAESFRIMTTNLQYLLVNAKNKDQGYCIYTTSTVKGEGKTFTSINLAVTLANTGKKVVIIGADLRNPQLQRYDTESKSFLGISDYLVNEDHQLQNLISDSKFHPNLKLLLSGSIPPNPSELLHQAKFGHMIQELREQFDYVIVDTAPSMLVADTFLISKYADLILYVTRAGYTEKKLLHFAVDAQNDGKLHDVSFVINDVKTANFGYGNKYGYAYGQSKPSLWERFKKSF